MRVRFFRTARHFRQWLEKHHSISDEIWIGFYRKGTGRIAMSYPEALDEALCFGWIDGIRRKVDEISYTNRFTPRRAHSSWSRKNFNRVRELEKLGRMAPSGRQAFANRDRSRTESYSFERKTVRFDAESARTFRSDAVAWTVFRSQPPGYRRIATWWVMSAKRPATRKRRLRALIAAAAQGRMAPPFDRTR